MCHNISRKEYVVEIIFYKDAKGRCPVADFRAG